MPHPEDSKSQRAAKTPASSASAESRRRQDEDPVGKVYDTRLMRRLGRYVRPYWFQAIVASAAVTLKSLCDVAGPILVMVAVDRYLAPDAADRDASNAVAHWVANASPLARLLPPDPFAGVSRLAAIYLILLVSAYLFQFIQVYLMQWTGQKIMFDLRRDIFRHMQRMHVGFFDVNPVGRLVTRLTSDVDAVNDMFTDGVLAIVNDFFMLTIMAVVMIAISWWLALLAFAVLPLILIVTRIFRDHVRESYRRVRTAIARINSFTQEHITGMSVVQLFNREDRAYRDFEAVNHQHMVAFKDTILAYALYYPAVDFLSSIAIALVVWRGGFGVLHLPPLVTIGVLIMFTQFSLRFWRPIQDLSDKYNILQAAMAASERIFHLLDSAPEIVSPANPIAGDQSGRVEFRNVWFTYQSLSETEQAILAAASLDELQNHSGIMATVRPIEWILRGVSFTVEPDETAAIVGHTGAGKTTITALMMRFYDIQHGQILIDGVDVRQQNLKSLRQRFGVVLQDPFLFTGTIADNIRLGSKWITDAALQSAAEEVNIADFIRTLPLQFDEPVRERGATLSTGQKQLISFARALAHAPSILILDEATSSVDTDTELRVRLALSRMITGRTSILSAHRLSTIQTADTILVMHKGQLRERGTHQQLLAQRGLYFKLYQLQYKDQEIAGPTNLPLHALSAD